MMIQSTAAAVQRTAASFITNNRMASGASGGEGQTGGGHSSIVCRQ